MPFDLTPREEPRRSPHDHFVITLSDDECAAMLRILGRNTPRMIARRVLEVLDAPDDLAKVMCAELPTYADSAGLYYPREWCGV